MAQKPFADRPHSWPEQNVRDDIGINGIVDAKSPTVQHVGARALNSGFHKLALARLSYVVTSHVDQFPQAIRKELSHRDVFAWIPVLLGLGIIAYFSLPREPDGLALAIVLAFSVLLSWRMRKMHSIFVVSVSCSLFVAGVVVAKLETERLSTPLLAQAGTYEISGRVSELVPSEKRTRVVLRDVLDRNQAPRQFAGVQLSAHNQHVQGLQIGDFVQVRARLEPMSGPLLPNGYDFRRVGYFKGLSARGFLLGEAVPFLEFSGESGPSLTDRLNKLRLDISGRISEVLPGQGGALAAALLVGQRSGIDDEVQEALRSSGLAHILAISGLHMALITSLIFGSVRLVGACARTLSAKYDVKKLAAATALVGAMIYLALSGSAISAQRAFLMASVFLVAILFDRAALTMRNVAISALVILVVQPSSILSPGFQMSFMAVIALVAVYRRDGLFSTLKRRFANKGVVAKTLAGSLGLLLTSVVAGFATSPFAIHHFYQAAIYGLLGNLAAMPIVGLIVMPMGIIALMLMPFGLEQLPLTIMEMGLKYVVAVSNWVAGIEGAVYIHGQQAALATLLTALCLLCLCLMRTKLRFLFASIVGLLCASTYFADNPQTLMFVSPDGKMVASKEPEGLTFYGNSRNQFTAGIWMRAVGDGRDVEDILRQSSDGGICDKTACTFSLETTAATTTQITVLRRAEAWFEACQSAADIIISSLDLPEQCVASSSYSEPALIDKSVLHANGAIRLDFLNGRTTPVSDTNNVVSTKLAALGLELTPALPRYKRPWH